MRAKTRYMAGAVRTTALAAAALSLVACGGESTEDIPAVTGFDAQRYLGTWYEIARLPNNFEDGLSNVTATYTARGDGTVNVVNGGIDEDSGSYDEATGRARFKGASDVGWLRVTFVPPFFALGGDYKIIDLDKDGYQHALVTSSTNDYLWFLSRDPVVDQQLIDDYVALGEELGFDMDSWIFVDQQMNSAP